MGGLPRADIWGAAMAHVDFEIFGGKTVYLLHPLPHEARDWVAEHLPADPLRLGDVPVEGRYVANVVGSAIANCLLVG